MVEVARDADLHGVALDRFVTSLELGQLGARRRTRAPRGKSGTEDVGHLDERSVVTDRTLLAASTADVSRRTQQFGVRIAHILGAQQPRGQLLEQRVTYEPELNDGSIGRRGAQRAIHWARLQRPATHVPPPNVTFDISN